MSNSPPAFLAKGDEGRTMTVLAEDFVPGENDVICGRGRRCYNHVGNERFRKFVESYLERYSNAGTKLEKSYILSEIVTHIRKLSPNGGFVKKDPDTGRWSEVGDFLAREKTSQAFRDALHEKYKSSNISKKKRRQAEQANKQQAQSPFETITEDSLSEADLQFALSNSKFMHSEPYYEMDNDLYAAMKKKISMQDSARSVMDFSSISNAHTATACFNRSCPDLGHGKASALRSTIPNSCVSSHNYDWGSHSSPSLFAGLAPPAQSDPTLPLRHFPCSKPERRLTPNEMAIEAMIERSLDTDLEEDAHLSAPKQEQQPVGSSNQMSVEAMLEPEPQKGAHPDVDMKEAVMEKPAGSSNQMTIEAIIGRSLEADLQEDSHFSVGKQEKSTFQQPVETPMQVISEAPGSMEGMVLSPVANEDSQGLFDSLMKLAERNSSVTDDDNPFEPNPIPERSRDR